MSSITEILSTDQVSDSREVINQNFDNLNTDKMEKSNNLSDLTNAGTARTNLGLGNVDNTSDANKPVSTAQQTALDLKVDSAIIKRIYKSADETVNNSNVYQDDDHLTFAIGANEVWAFILHLIYTSGTTPDLKYKFTIPASATHNYYSNFVLNEVGTGTAQSEVVLSGAGATVQGELATGVVINSSNAGSVTLQWAQNTQNASDTKVLKGSYIIAHRLA